MSDEKWKDDRVQFPRLIAEISAIGLSPQQISGLCRSMNLHPNEVTELLQRAETEWERLKDVERTSPQDGISDEQYRERAKEKFHDEGTLEIDDNARVSRGDDDGAYVEAWVWVERPEVAETKA